MTKSGQYSVGWYKYHPVTLRDLSASHLHQLKSSELSKILIAQFGPPKLGMRHKINHRVSYNSYFKSSLHLLEFHALGCHVKGRTPVVDGKYYDRETGAVRLASEGDHQEYMGLPAVDFDVLCFFFVFFFCL